MDPFGPPGGPPGPPGGPGGPQEGMGGGDNNGGVILAVVYTTTTMMFSTLCLRLYVRWRYSGIRLDDWSHVAASCFVIATAAVIALGVKYGAGRHKLDIGPIETIEGLKWNWILNLMFIITTFVVKLAICSSLLYLAQRSRVYRLAIYAFVVFMTTYSLIFWLPSILECRPQKFVYDKKDTEGGECLPVSLMRGLEITHTLMNSGANIVLVALLVAMHWGRIMERKSKYGLGAVVFLGLFATGSSIARSSFVFRDSRSNDTLYDSKSLSICTILEISFGIIASCIGCLGPLLWGHHVSLTNIVVVDPQTRQSGTRENGLGREGRGTPSQPLVRMNPVRWIQRGVISRQKGSLSIDNGGEMHPAFQTIIPPVKNIESIRGGDRGFGIGS